MPNLTTIPNRPPQLDHKNDHIVFSASARKPEISLPSGGARNCNERRRKKPGREKKQGVLGFSGTGRWFVSRSSFSGWAGSRARAGRQDEERVPTRERERRDFFEGSCARAGLEEKKEVGLATYGRLFPIPGVRIRFPR